MTRSGLGTRGLGLAVTLGAIAFAVVLAQTPAPQQPPTFRTEANYVRVDAYPTKDEAPVTDLTQSDFEILESGTPQKIEQFERVVIQSRRPAGHAHRAQHRARVAGHGAELPRPARRAVPRHLSRRSRRLAPDSQTARRRARSLIGHGRPRRGDDAGDVGHRYHLRAQDDDDRRLPDALLALGRARQDEPRRPGGSGVHRAATRTCLRNADCADQNGIAAEMLDRRHEKLVLDALEDLVGYLRGVREERKAILAISDGWLLFRPNETLARPLECEGVPTGPKVSIDPRSGRLTTKDPNDGSAPKQTVRDRSDAPGAARQRSAIPRSSRCRESRQRVVLSDRSARARGLRHPVDEAGRPRTRRRRWSRPRSIKPCCAAASIRCRHSPRQPTVWRS